MHARRRESAPDRLTGKTDDQTGGRPQERLHEHLHGRPDKATVERACATLRRNGQRVTATRQRVLEVLVEHPRQHTADQIADLLADHQVHRSTAYRTLELFTRLGIVSVSSLGHEAATYHLVSDTHLHGHCLRCHAVIALPADLLAAVADRLARDGGFALDAQASTLTGVCGECAGSS